VINVLKEVIGYVQLDEREQQLLRELHPRMEPHFPEIADRVTTALGTTVQIDWLASGMLGAFREQRTPLAPGIPQHVAVAAISVLRTACIDTIRKLYPLDQVADVVRALNKLLDIELAMMMRYYQRDSEAIQADRLTALQTLSSGLAHEVRNPLNAARLQLELLERRLRRSNDDPKLVEPIELANHEIERLTALLNDFLSFARPPELHLHDQDVVDICKHVLELERPLAERRRIKLELAAHAPLVAQVDSGKIHQIVQNLVRNGLEATRAGGHVQVIIDDGVSNAFHIRVRDDGPGIPSEVLPRIYEPFFSTKETGTGMGMAIVHSLVSMHGGKIDIATGEGGTLFDIELPRE
jgi:signal transduction histidine kinase